MDSRWCPIYSKVGRIDKTTDHDDYKVQKLLDLVFDEDSDENESESEVDSWKSDEDYQEGVEDER